MNNRKIVFCWGLIFLAIALPLIVAGYRYYKEEHFSCESTLSIIEGQSTYEMIMLYTFSGGSGFYESQGRLQEEGKPILSTSNRVNFDYWWEKGNIIMVSVSQNGEPKAVSRTIPDIPDFFHFRERGLKIHLQRENASSYVFIHDGAPLFYCSNL